MCYNGLMYSTYMYVHVYVHTCTCTYSVCTRYVSVHKWQMYMYMYYYAALTRGLHSRWGTHQTQPLSCPNRINSAQRLGKKPPQKSPLSYNIHVHVGGLSLTKKLTVHQCNSKWIAAPSSSSHYQEATIKQRDRKLIYMYNMLRVMDLGGLQPGCQWKNTTLPVQKAHPGMLSIYRTRVYFSK